MATDTIIDELKVVVSLDPAQFKAGQDKLLAGFDNAKSKARKTAEELEASGKQGGEFFDLLTDKALKLGTVLLGGVGLKDFVQSSIAGGAATGYMAKNIGITTQELTKWQNVVRQVGGDASQVGPGLLALSQALTQVQLNAKANPELVQAFQYLGIYGTQFFDQVTGRAKTFGELLPSIQAGLANLAKTSGAPFAIAIGNQIGVPQDLITAAVSPEYQKFVEQADRVSSLTERQRQDLQKLTSVWGLYKGALDTTGRALGADVAEGFEAAAPAIEKVVRALESVDRNALRDLGELLGGLAGAFSAGGVGLGLGTLAGGPVGGLIGLIIGGLVGGLGGAVGGGSLGAAAKRTNDAINPAAPAGASRSTGGGASLDHKLAPGQTSYEPTSVTAKDLTFAANVFSIIQQLEGGKAGTVTPTGKADDPYAYGKNQITLGTAQRFDKSATAAKLLDAAYNDALARKIEAAYIERYHGDLDAIAIAYHNGPDAADRFVKSGGTAGIENFGPKSQRYLDRERALAAATNTTTSSTAINGPINVNAPKATNAAGVAAGLREELAKYGLMSQANTVGAQ